MRAPHAWRAAFILTVIAAGSRAQDPLSPTEDRTPVNNAIGAPTGSYLLTVHEAVNLYNGTLSFSVPLHRIEGRGNAGYTMVLPVGGKWQIPTHMNAGELSFVPIYTALPIDPYWQLGAPPRYTPGAIVRRDAVDQTAGTYSACATGTAGAGYTYYFGSTLTQLVWIEADGTEHPLRDTGTTGTPQPQPQQNSAICSTDPVNGGYNRGTVFESDDSTSMTFIADGPVLDSITTLTRATNSGKGVAGWLLFRDGTRYYTDLFGRVTIIEDRSGNRISLQYISPGLVVTDSLGRTTTVTLNTSNGSPDTIQYTGAPDAGGTPQTHTITIQYDLLSNLDSQTPSSSPLFPSTFSSVSAASGYAVSRIVLEDQSQYAFWYNNYGELSRVVLPTGGAWEYDYPASTPECDGTQATSTACVSVSSESEADDNDIPVLSVYRRLTERRVFSAGATPAGGTTGAVLEGRTDYSSYQGMVTVSSYDAAGTLLSTDNHHFNGDPSLNGGYVPPPQQWYEDFRTPLEIESDLGVTSCSGVGCGGTGAVTLKTVQHLHGATAGPGSNTGYLNPFECETVETLASAGTASTISSGTFSIFDQYSNLTDLFEYDYGSGLAIGATCPASAPGGYARQKHTAYAAGDYVAVSTTATSNNHMRNLPVETDTYDAAVSTSSPAAQTTYAYDQGTLTGRSPAFTAGYAAPAHTKLGNLTTATRVHLSNSAKSAVTTAGYDVLGNVVAGTDANLKTTSLGYDDACDLGPVGQFAYRTSTTNPLGQVTSFRYDCDTGEVTSTTDPNSVITRYSHAADPFDRLTEVIAAAGVSGRESHTKYQYPNLNTMVVNSDLNTAQDGAMHSVVLTDGLGRVSENDSYIDGSHYIAVQRRYDGKGRLAGVSNPYRTDTETEH